MTDEDKAKRLYNIAVEFGYIDKSWSFEKLCAFVKEDTSIRVSLDRRLLGILALQVIDPFILNGLLDNPEGSTVRKFSLRKLVRSILVFLGLDKKSKPAESRNRVKEVSDSSASTFKLGHTPSASESTSPLEKPAVLPKVSSQHDLYRTTRQATFSTGQTEDQHPAPTQKEQSTSSTRKTQDQPVSRLMTSTIQTKKYLFLVVNRSQFTNKFPGVPFTLLAEEAKGFYNLPWFLLPGQGDETLNRIKSLVDNSISEGRVVLYVEPDDMSHFRKESPGSEKREAFQSLAGKTIVVLGVVASKQLDGLGLPFFAIN
ncbi:MAG: hypothetical protein LBL76_07735 [Treponema sp.]|nr:hypothetical protein [Treponema sp.]